MTVQNCSQCPFARDLNDRNRYVCTAMTSIQSVVKGDHKPVSECLQLIANR